MAASEEVTKTGDQSLGGSLKVLMQVVALDQRIARVVAERKRQIKLLKERTAFFDEAQKEYESAKSATQEVRDRYDKEEAGLKEEREKLKGRRKALATFSNYKVQQSALQELERAERLLAVREESLFAIVDNLDEVEDAEKLAAERLAESEVAFKEIKAESQEGCADLEAQFKQARKEREELLQHVPADVRRVYSQVYERYAADAVVPVQKKHCSGCYMTVPPQVMVELHNCEQIVKCRGCGRILVIDGSESEESEE